MKTAMQQLIDFLEPELKMHDFLQLPAYEKAKSLLETEKKQIIDAHCAGQAIEDTAGVTDALEYINETFNQ